MILLMLNCFSTALVFNQEYIIIMKYFINTKFLSYNNRWMTYL